MWWKELPQPLVRQAPPHCMLRVRLSWATQAHRAVAEHAGDFGLRQAAPAHFRCGASAFRIGLALDVQMRGLAGAGRSDETFDRGVSAWRKQCQCASQAGQAVPLAAAFYLNNIEGRFLRGSH